MDASIASMNKSTFEERQRNVSYLRTLYFLFAIEFVVALLFCYFTTEIWSGLGRFIVDWWYFAAIALVICVLMVLLTFFVPAVRKFPVNLVIYLLFTLAFAWVWAYIVNRFSTNSIGWYVLWLLAAIAFAFAIYSWYVTPSNY